MGAQDVDSARIWAQRESENFTDYFFADFSNYNGYFVSFGHGVG